MKLFAKKRVLLILLVSFFVFVFLSSNWMAIFYPIRYKDEIREYAQTYEVDPFLVASIIRVETNYNTSLESHKGALGLMQIMPDTAQWIMERAKLPKQPLDNVKHEAGLNIQLGSWYIHNLMEQFPDQPIAMIAAYNAGPGKVESWISEGVWDGREETIRQIPYGETRHYVQRVTHYYRQYTKIYDRF